MYASMPSEDERRAALGVAYVEAHAFVIHYLDEISGRIHELPSPESDGLDWAHVGALITVKQDLREIVAFLAGDHDLGERPMTEITIRAIECESMSDAIQEANAGGRGEAVLVDGTPMVVPQADLDELAAAGGEFAYLYSRTMSDGSCRIITVPVN